jgi:hypothetical protein
MYILQVLAPRRNIFRDVAAVAAGAAPVTVPGLTTSGDPSDSQSMYTEFLESKSNQIQVHGSKRTPKVTTCDLLTQLRSKLCG